MKSAVCLLLFAIAVSAQTGAIVEGTVTDSGTYTPVAGVTVTLQPPQQQKGESYTATSDASGAFRIVGLQPGEYLAVYEKDGFWPQIKGGIRAGIGATTRADIELGALGILRGRVLDPENKPVPKASVKLEAFDDGVETDLEGRYEIKDLPPGAYSLRASVKPPESASKPAQTAERIEIVPTYYPSTINQPEAELVQVRPGADLAGYDIHLRTAHVYWIRGKVLDEAGKPVPKAEVTLLGPGEDRVLVHRLLFGSLQVPMDYFINQHGQQQVEATTASGKDGSFEFPSVSPGEWNLQARKENEPTYMAGNAVKATVSDRDIDAVELQIAPPFALQVTANWGGQQSPAPNSVPPVILLPQKDSHMVISSRNGLKPTLSPGQYRIVPIPARAPGFYPAAVMLAGRNMQGQDVELTSATAALQVVYRPNPGTVRGTVEEGEGSTVLLWPLGAASPDIVPTVRARAHGAFEFTNVPPGDYSVIALDRIPERGAPAALANTLVARGTRVSIQEGGIESVQTEVQRWAQ